MRPDYLVAKYNVTHMETISKQDALYLTSLSSDAVQALVEITDKQLEEDKNDSDIDYLPTSKDQIRTYFENVSINYNDGLRYFNLGEYFAYQAVQIPLSNK